MHSIVLELVPEVLPRLRYVHGLLEHAFVIMRSACVVMRNVFGLMGLVSETGLENMVHAEAYFWRMHVYAGRKLTAMRCP